MLLAGCASAPEPVAVDVGGAIARWGAVEPEATSSRVVAREASTRRTRPSARRWTGGPRIDLELHRAPLAEALRFVAEQAGYGIVVGEGLERPITVSLRRVPALEALALIAAAHRVELERVGRNIVARPL